MDVVTHTAGPNTYSEVSHLHRLAKVTTLEIAEIKTNGTGVSAVVELGWGDTLGHFLETSSLAEESFASSPEVQVELCST